MSVLLLNVKVSRIFAANLLLKSSAECRADYSPCSIVAGDVYLVTSDTDLWPISTSAYNLPDGMDALLLNAFCCGTFRHGKETYQMVPLSNIGARIATWLNLTKR